MIFMSLSSLLSQIHTRTFILTLSLFLSLFIILDTLFRYWQTNTIRNLVTNWKFDGTAEFRKRWTVDSWKKLRAIVDAWNDFEKSVSLGREIGSVYLNLKSRWTYKIKKRERENLGYKSRILSRWRTKKNVVLDERDGTVYMEKRK